MGVNKRDTDTGKDSSTVVFVDMACEGDDGKSSKCNEVTCRNDRNGILEVVSYNRSSPRDKYCIISNAEVLLVVGVVVPSSFVHALSCNMVGNCPFTKNASVRSVTNLGSNVVVANSVAALT